MVPHCFYQTYLVLLKCKWTEVPPSDGDVALVICLAAAPIPQPAPTRDALILLTLSSLLVGAVQTFKGILSIIVNLRNADLI